MINDSNETLLLRDNTQICLVKQINISSISEIEERPSKSLLTLLKEHLLQILHVIITDTHSVGGTAPGINRFHWLNDTAIVVEFLKSLLPATSLVSSGGSVIIIRIIIMIR